MILERHNPVGVQPGTGDAVANGCASLARMMTLAPMSALPTDKD